MAMRHDFPVELPAALVAQGMTLRQERDDDVAFLAMLYGSTRAAELALMTQWGDAEKAAFVRQQFMAQRHHYRTAITGVRFAVIEVRDEPIGRLYVQQRESVIQLVDITLHPERRSTGIGTALIGAVIDSAARRGLGVGLFVERYSAALPLYRRLGFDTLVEHDVYLEMDRPLSQDQLKTAS